MNRLILIGNGFDMAHKMKTSYLNFIEWYKLKCFTYAAEIADFSDEIWTISFNYRGYRILSARDIEDYINKNYGENFKNHKKSRITFFGFDDDTPRNRPPKPLFDVKIKQESNLFETLLNSCAEYHWVDIENEYFKSLKAIYEEGKNPRQKVIQLNSVLECLIKNLKDYLLELDNGPFLVGYPEIFNSIINVNESYFTRDELLTSPYHDEFPRNTKILNFNYTPTVQKYLESGTVNNVKKYSVNYIHGQIDNPNNPMIFGFGDEVNPLYSQLEAENINEYFRYIKSFWYFKTNNYRDLVRFISGDMYQVVVLGHSCGLSDRTMLKMIFENENCKSIKVYAHYKEDGSSNYENLTHEISRHFSDKKLFRNLLVSEDPFNRMPQA